MNGIGIKWLTVALVMGMAGFKTGAEETKVDAEKTKIKVLTSFLPLYVFTVNVAGDAARVENLLPGATGPHEYMFSREDAQKIQRADLIVINGMELEPWLESVLKNVRGEKKLVEASAGMEKELIYGEASGGRNEGRAKGIANAHLWLDAELACGMVSNIAAALQKADPANAATYKTNAATYIGKLKNLDSELREALKPHAGSAIITHHDAFPYFARRYEVKIAGVIEATPNAALGPRDLSRLYQAARQEKVKAVCVEPGSRPAQANQIGKDLGLPLVELDNMETGEMGAGTYEKVMRRNVRALLKVFGQN